MPSIKDQSILIIGGTSGIGFAAAQLALEQGACVAVASSNPTRISTALDKLKSSFPDAQIAGYECDVSKPDIEASLLALFSTATDNGAKLLDHIIYTAIGAIDLTPLAELSSEAIQKAGHFHCLAPMIIGKLTPRFLNPGYKSSLIFTSGQIAEKPLKGWTVQCAYATALYGITRALALDLAPRRVNCVSPGATITELWGSLEQREKRAEMMRERMLLGKVGSPEEVAEAYVYLMRNWNATGSVVGSDGGSMLN
jgi:NAD(P)-dependent dehydrogenase (short-subunit alcohol dehydrogenase family)